MHTEFQPEDPDVLKEMGYDRRDLKIPMVRSYTFWITFSCFLCFIVSIPVYNWATTPGGVIQSSLGTTREPAAPTTNKIQPPNPLLQDNWGTKVDIQQQRIHEDEVLGSFGWVDQNKGVVRMPVDKAMSMIVERGVSTGNTVPAKTTGNTITQNAVGPGTSGADKPAN